MTSFSQMLYTLNREVTEGCDGCLSLMWTAHFVVDLDDSGTVVLVILLAVITLYLLMGILSVFMQESMLDFVTETAYLEYWSNRLAYMHEMRSWTKCSCCFCPSCRGLVKYLNKSWNFLINSLKKDIHRPYYDDKLNTHRGFLWFLVRIFALLAIPLFIVSGLLTAGILWPPQVRRYILRSFDCYYYRGSRTYPKSWGKEASALRIDLNRLETSSAEQKSILKNELTAMKDILIQMNMRLSEKGIVGS